jgi:probable F420-dependent oxidoreductase
MRFSISMTTGTDRPISARDIEKYAQNVEKLGYYAIYLPDHYYHHYCNFHAMSAAAVTAAVTKTVKIGFSAYQVPIRHPIAVAKKFAMLDALSEGRVIAGLATGSFAGEFTALGLDFKKRGAMMDEGLEAIKRLWTEESVKHSGEFWSFEDVAIEAGPVQKPYPPIWIASWTGGGRPARRVAEHGDGWQASGLHTPIAQLTEGWAHIAKAAEDIGRNPADIGRAYVNTVTHFGSDPESAWNDFIKLSEKNKSRHKDLCFMGTPDDVAAKVNELKEAGMDELSFLLGVDDHEKTEIIAKEVMPKVNG